MSVASLRKAGLVRSTRGARGGYELALEPVDIRMSQVVEALEGRIAPMVCASDDPQHADMCDRTDYCNVNLLWTRVRDAVVGALDSLTLAELATLNARHPVHSGPVIHTIAPLAERHSKEPIARP